MTTINPKMIYTNMEVNVANSGHKPYDISYVKKIVQINTQNPDKGEKGSVLDRKHGKLKSIPNTYGTMGTTGEEESDTTCYMNPESIRIYYDFYVLVGGKTKFLAHNVEARRFQYSVPEKRWVEVFVALGRFKYADSSRVTPFTIKSTNVNVKKDNGGINQSSSVKSILPLRVAQSPHKLLFGEDSKAHTGQKLNMPMYDEMEHTTEEECFEMFQRILINGSGRYPGMNAVVRELAAKYRGKEPNKKDYQSSTLNQIIAEDANFIGYKNAIIKGVTENLSKSSWSLNELVKKSVTDEERVFKSHEKDKAKRKNPAFNRKPENVYNGLLITIDTIAFAECFLVEYVPPSGNTFKAKFQFVLWDVFGFDREDVKKYGERTYWGALSNQTSGFQKLVAAAADGSFTSWWRLQHYFGCTPFRIRAEVTTDLLELSTIV